MKGDKFTINIEIINKDEAEKMFQSMSDGKTLFGGCLVTACSREDLFKRSWEIEEKISKVFEEDDCFEYEDRINEILSETYMHKEQK